jgi:hypothetical protein
VRDFNFFELGKSLKFAKQPEMSLLLSDIVQKSSSSAALDYK